MSKIPNPAAELFGNTKLKPSSDDLENPTKITESLARAIDSLPDDKWEELSIEAQEWANAACRALRHGHDLPPLDFKELVTGQPTTSTEQAAPSNPGRPPKSGQIKRRNVWGTGTVSGTVAEMVVESNLTNLDPAKLVTELRNRNTKASISTVDGAITSTLTVFAALLRKGWISKDIDTDTITNGVEEANDAL